MNSVLERHGLTDGERQRILEYAAAQRQRVETILKADCMEDEVADITKEEFELRPLTMNLSGVFCDKDIPYRYEEYLAHWKSTESFAANHPNYTLKKVSSHAFHNLQILIHVND